MALGLSGCAYGSSLTDDPGGAGSEIDGGVIAADAGHARVDASSDAGGARDGGVHEDAAVAVDPGEPDADVIVDAGAPDTRVVADANVPVDAGHVIDAGAPDTGGSTCAAHGFSGTLVTFDLASQPGSESTAPATASAAGVSSGALARGASLTATSGSASINSSNWPTAASADASRYYTFTVTPGAGCVLALTSLALDVRASTTGPASGDVATSADGFGGHTAAFTGTSTKTVALAGAGGAGPIEIRVYGFGASGSAGTWRIQNTMTLTGTLE